MIEKQSDDRSLVAPIILDSYLETRSKASRWSGVYWGCVFAAAALSALAALVLKFETLFKSEGVKKDVATTLSISSAGRAEPAQAADGSSAVASRAARLLRPREASLLPSRSATGYVADALSVGP